MGHRKHRARLRRCAAATAGALLLAWPTAAARAEVVLDGTLGRAGALAGPEFRIRAEDGRRAGDNLFHSFSRFNLANRERATFSGPGSIRHVIGRVTGGEASSIDGTLASTIPSADLWLLNPSGILFGPNARLEVQGSFHASTADELRFADGAVFSALDPSGSVLSVAEPQAFGFLGGQPPGDVRLQGSALEVPPSRTLSLVGGNVEATAGPERTLRTRAVSRRIPTARATPAGSRSRPGRSRWTARPSPAKRSVRAAAAPSA